MGCVQVSIFTFGPKKVKDRNVGKLTVRGKGWDATIGGWWFDLKLADVFADAFNAKVRAGLFGGGVGGSWRGISENNAPVYMSLTRL